MTTVRTSWIRDRRLRVARVPRPRQAPSSGPAAGPRREPATPDEVRVSVAGLARPEPSLLRTAAAAALGMLLLAALLGTVGALALGWLGTRMLDLVR